MNPSLTNQPAFEAAEYTRKAGTRRHGGTSTAGSTSRLRLLFFGAASLWGS
jgi:hypothetical protein